VKGNKTPVKNVAEGGRQN